MALSARGLMLVVSLVTTGALRDQNEESGLLGALQNRSGMSMSSGPPLDLDGTVAKKGWECGQPEKDVPNRDLVKDAKSKAQNLVYNWLKTDVCPEEKQHFWRAMRPSVLDEKRGEPCKSSITGTEDSIGCMKLDWDLDAGNCGSHQGRDRRGRERTYETKRGTATVLCSDIMSETVRRKYGVDQLKSSIAWFHV